MNTSTTRTVLVLCGFRDWFRLDLFGHPFWGIDLVVRRWSFCGILNSRYWSFVRGELFLSRQVGTPGTYTSVGPLRVTHYPKVV